MAALLRPRGFSANLPIRLRGSISTLHRRRGWMMGSRGCRKAQRAWRCGRLFSSRWIGIIARARRGCDCFFLRTLARGGTPVPAFKLVVAYRIEPTLKFPVEIEVPPILRNFPAH